MEQHEREPPETENTGIQTPVAKAHYHRSQELSRLPGDVAAPTALSGRALWAMFGHAALWLRSNAAHINAINVFPVPDGDTGFNMSATLDAAVEAAVPASDDAGTVMQFMQGGALLGARGNSGVILSQALAGMAAATVGLSSVDGWALANAFRLAEQSARLAVAKPKQGTMLTVLADVAAAVGICAPEGPRAVLTAAADAARASVTRTPDLLPILREAGVVDSGGLGIQLILEGCVLALDGDRLPLAPRDVEAGRNLAGVRSRFNHVHGTPIGYCTEFLIAGTALQREAILTALQPVGESLLVVGSESLIRVHIHTPDPGAVLSLGLRYGTLDKIKIDNFDSQYRAIEYKPTRDAGTCVVAIARGDGFEQLFRQYGATVVEGAQTTNASTAEILHALDRSGCASMLLLPNNHNQLAAAEQAAALSKRAVTVIATLSEPEGIAALLAFNPELALQENERTMREAAARVHTIELTHAVRDVSVGGVGAFKDQPIGLLDRRLVASGAAWKDVALTSLSALDSGYEAVDIFYGAGVTVSEAEELAAAFRGHSSGVEVNVVRGGQESFPFIIAVE